MIVKGIELALGFALGTLALVIATPVIIFCIWLFFTMLDMMWKYIKKLWNDDEKY